MDDREPRKRRKRRENQASSDDASKPQEQKQAQKLPLSAPPSATLPGDDEGSGYLFWIVVIVVGCLSGAAILVLFAGESPDGLKQSHVQSEAIMSPHEASEPRILTSIPEHVVVESTETVDEDRLNRQETPPFTMEDTIMPTATSDQAEVSSSETSSPASEPEVPSLMQTQSTSTQPYEATQATTGFEPPPPMPPTTHTDEQQQLPNPPAGDEGFEPALGPDFEAAQRDARELPEATLKRLAPFIASPQLSKNPRVHLARAVALDSLAKRMRSNKVFRECIDAYVKTLSLFTSSPSPLLLSTSSLSTDGSSVGRRERARAAFYLGVLTVTVDRMRFLGQQTQIVKVLDDALHFFPKNATLYNLRGVALLYMNQNDRAQQAFETALSLDGGDEFAKVHLGFIVKTRASNEADYERAIRLLEEGIESEAEGTMDGRFFVHLGDALTRMGRANETHRWYEKAVAKGLFPSAQQRSLYNVKGLRAQPWWRIDETPYAAGLRHLAGHWKIIRDEALALLDKKSSFFAPDDEKLTASGEWHQLELYARGRRDDNICKLLPRTCQLVETIPAATTCKRGQIKLSRLVGGSRVWPHTGPTNCRLRAHIGLVTPAGAAISVASITRKWSEGGVLLFDDSFEHEVWHNGTEPRLILIVDLWHPELTPRQRAALSPI